MTSRNVILALLISISVTGTFYSIMIFFISQNSSAAYAGSYNYLLLQSLAVRYSYSLIPPLLTAFAWLATGIQVYTMRRKDIFLTLRKEMSGELDRDVIKDLFNKRGSGLRLSIIGLLEFPMFRSELARVTGADWKEVDRNVKILSSVGLIHLKREHGPIAEFELTEKGQKVYKKIKTAVTKDMSR